MSQIPGHPTKIAIIGSGYFGAFHLNAWLRISDVEVVAVVEASQARRRELSETYSDIGIFENIDEVLATLSPDLVDIATPPGTHVELIKSLINEVPTIVCQKPFCGGYKEACEMVDLAKQSDTRLIVHENFRFMPWYRTIRNVLDQGNLGEVRQASFWFRPGDGNGPDAYLDRQPYFRQMERFLVHETAIHWIDVFRFLFGEPNSVYADLWKSNPTIAGEDSGIIVFNFERGCNVVFDGNRTLDHRADNHRLTMGEMAIEGANASLYLGGNGELAVRRFGSNLSESIAYEFENTDFGGDCVFHFQNHVISHLRNNTALETEASTYVENQRIEELVYESSRTGRKIELN